MTFIIDLTVAILLLTLLLFFQCRSSKQFTPLNESFLQTESVQAISSSKLFLVLLISPKHFLRCSVRAFFSYKVQLKSWVFQSSQNSKLINFYRTWRNGHPLSNSLQNSRIKLFWIFVEGKKVLILSVPCDKYTPSCQTVVRKGNFPRNWRRLFFKCNRRVVVWSGNGPFVCELLCAGLKPGISSSWGAPWGELPTGEEGEGEIMKWGRELLRKIGTSLWIWRSKSYTAFSS